MSLREIPLGQMTEPGRPITYGVVKPGPEDPDRGIPFVRGGDIRDGKIALNELRTITEEVSRPYARTLLKGGELLISLVGNPGEVAIAPESLAGANIARQAGLIALRSEFDALYVMYFLRSPAGRAGLFERTQGAVQQVINLSALKTVSIRLPSLTMQRRVATILSSYDELIENNERRITLLEDAAQQLYKEWFVRLRFPGHEHVEITDGLPRGWMPVAFAEMADVVRGRSYTSAELCDEGGRAFVNLKCIKRFGGFRDSGIKGIQGSFKEKHMVNPGDIVMAVTDMTRDAMIVAQSGRISKTIETNAIFSMDLVKIVPKPNIQRDWLYSLLRFSRFPFDVREHANGTNVLHLKPKYIEEWRGALPPEQLRDWFVDAVQPVFDQIDNLQLQSRNAAQARDLLLPRLMSGAITV